MDVLDRLGEPHGALVSRGGAAVHLAQRHDQVHAERCRTGHSAARDVAVDRDVDALADRLPFGGEHVQRSGRVAGPAAQGADVREMQRVEVDHSLVLEARADEPDAARGVRAGSQPQEAVGPDPEQLGAVVIAVLHTETEARRGASHACLAEVQAMPRGKSAERSQGLFVTLRHAAGIMLGQGLGFHREDGARLRFGPAYPPAVRSVCGLASWMLLGEDRRRASRSASHLSRRPDRPRGGHGDGLRAREGGL